MSDDLRHVLRERVEQRLHEIDREVDALERAKVALVGERPRRGRPPKKLLREAEMVRAGMPRAVA
jgi:hypothetical protein